MSLSPPKRKKRLYAIIIIAIVLAAAGGITYYINQSPKQLTPVSFVFDFTLQGRYVPFYAAQAHGYYKDVGLAVSFIKGQGSSFAVTSVDQGKATFADADFGALVLTIARGAHVKAIAMFEDGDPVALACDVPVFKPSDLVNKSIATNPFSASRYLFPLMLKINSVDLSKVRFLLVDPSVAIPGFLQHNYECTEAFVDNNLLIIQSQIANKTKLYTLLESHWGVSKPGYVLLAADSTLQQNPQLVKNFIEATIKGVQYAMANPTDAINEFLAAEPAIGRTIAIKQWNASANLMRTPSALNSYGYINPQEFQNGVNTFVNGYGKDLNLSKPATEMYTNQFVPGNVSLPALGKFPQISSLSGLVAIGYLSYHYAHPRRRLDCTAVPLNSLHPLGR